MPVHVETSDKWVRAHVGDVPVVDSRAPVLFYEDTFPVPGYAFARSDVLLDVLRPNATGPDGGPFFFLPKGPVLGWFDLDVGGRRIPHVAWIRDEPELRDLLIYSWRPGLIDRWLEEDEVVAGHPRDPHKRVEALASSRHVVVSVGGRTLADTRNPVLLFETGLPTRYYVPRADVDFDVLAPSVNFSLCPYKGDTDQYWSVAGLPEAKNIAWSYAEPFPAVHKIAGRIAFYNELVDVTVDGALLSRPVSVFSQPRNRPGS